VKTEPPNDPAHAMRAAKQTPELADSVARPSLRAAPGSAFPPVLDACCGSRMMWFEREDARALFMDVRAGEWSKDYGTSSSIGRNPIVVRPDVRGDFTSMPFPDESFYLVVFDPPHHTDAWFGKGCSIMKNSYGALLPGWEEMLRKGFEECFRVLKPHGTLIFKWGDREIPLARVIGLTAQRPLFGSRSSKNAHWIAFLKQNARGELPPPSEPKT
jgi:SAM-dependent methyltransferase